MLANELRAIATKISGDNSQKEIDSAVEYLENLTLQHAQLGKFGLRIETSKLPFIKNLLVKTFPVLNRKGYSCSIKNEVTAWYSNTDCDAEDFLYINW